jgi:uncharacterized membrane protein
MSTLVAVSYPSEDAAATVINKLIELQKEKIVTLEDAVYVTKTADGKPQLHQTHNLVGAGALGGAFWGLLFGMLFLMPFVGAAIGAASGAFAGSLSDIGVDDDFARKLAESLTPGSSLVIVLIREATADKLIEQVAPFGGTVIQSSLSNEDQAKLQASLNAGHPVA